MTGIEFVREYFPSATEAQADSLLWCGTAFPCSTIETYRRQLQHLKDLVGPSPEKALALAAKEFDEEFRRIVEAK